MQEVITNLGAAKLEFRAEDDPDVVPYTHGRNIEVLLHDISECTKDLNVLRLPSSSRPALSIVSTAARHG